MQCFFLLLFAVTYLYAGYELGVSTNTIDVMKRQYTIDNRWILIIGWAPLFASARFANYVEREEEKRYQSSLVKDSSYDKSTDIEESRYPADAYVNFSQAEKDSEWAKMNLGFPSDFSIGDIANLSGNFSAHYD
jgi:hypothetical protein